MAKVVIKIKALPKDVSQDAEKLRTELKSFLSGYGSIYKSEIEPLAFGLKIILITLVTDEAQGTSKLEEGFSKFKEAEMSIVDVSRMPDF